MVQKVHPIYKPDQPRSFLGKTLTEVDVTVAGLTRTANDALTATELAPRGLVDKVLKTLAQKVTIVMIGTFNVATANQVGLKIFVEGEFPGDDLYGTGVDFTDQLAADLISNGYAGSTAALGITYRADQVYTSAAVNLVNG